ncbi:hypothetical protein CYY_009703 [Polysphondylium violaceum]|uniref:Pleckstrin domain-containing protein n=1 Tax=Polysphondylium violaceum TaxID=133409 RepID=A0A8J4PL43_9MYCE|nr:hypothetical protein CYY_009703 [Polysphondylium violaceum]
MMNNNSNPLSSSSGTTWIKSTGGSMSNKNRLVGYLQKQAKQQPNSNVKIYKKKWFWFDSDNGVVYYSNSAIGNYSATPSLLSSASKSNEKSIQIDNFTYIEQSVSFRLEFTITLENINKVYVLRGTDEGSVLNWVNSLNQWKTTKLTNVQSNQTTPELCVLSDSSLLSKSSSIHFNDLDDNSNIHYSIADSIISHKGGDPSTIVNNLSSRIATLDKIQIKQILSSIESQIDYLQKCYQEVLELSFPQQQKQNTTITTTTTTSNPLSASTSIDNYEEEEDDDELNSLSLTSNQAFTESSDIFSLLPNHLSLYIFSYLEPNDLIICSQVSTLWKKLANDNLLWIRFVFNMITPASVFDTTHHWKSVYVANTKKITSGKEKYMNRAISMYGLAPLESSNSIKEGWLYKRGDDLLRIWKKRYFVLRENSLFYFKHQQDNFPCGMIFLNPKTIVKRASNSTRKHIFKILQGKHQIVGQKKRMPYYLSCDKEEECAEWMKILTVVISSNKQNQESYGVIQVTNHGTDLNQFTTILNNSTSFKNQSSQYHTVPFNQNSNAGVAVGASPAPITPNSKPSHKSHKKALSASSTPSSPTSLDHHHHHHHNLLPPSSPNTVVNTPPLVPMFGLNLQTLMKNQSSNPNQSHLKIPYLLSVCFQEIINTGLKEEGIFRLSGSVKEVQSLQESFEQGKEIDLSQHDIHAITGIVKQFFRRLPSHSLISHDLDEYATAVQLASSQTEEEKIQEFKFIFDSISKESHNIFAALLYLLKLVTQNGAQNKMTVENLLIVIMPTLKCSPVLITNGIKFHHKIFTEDNYIS